jgi:hypothetical protein
LPSSGIPVSTFLSVPHGSRSDVVRHALGLIDAVHGDGELALLGFEFSLNQAYAAAAYAIDEGRPSAILLPKTGRISVCAIVEEIGHMLDHQVLNGRPWASKYSDSDLHEVVACIQTSEMVRRVMSYRCGENLSLVLRGKQKRVVVFDQDELDYHQDIKEWWARAYVQFIAEASQDSGMLEEIAHYTSTPNHQLMYPTAWNVNDFKPIKQAIWRTFRAKGWMK